MAERVYCLYRVSTAKQVDRNEQNQADIRKLCAERGQFMGSHAPFGYKKSEQDGHKLVIDVETAPTVRKIFELRCAGKGFMAIASTLNEAKLASPLEYHYAQLGTPCPIKSCGVWSATSVKRLLENA